MFEEMLKINEVTKLDFKIEVFGLYVKIRSKHSTWFIKNSCNMPKKILLYHNDTRGRNNMHKQGHYDNVLHVLLYIDGHDNKLLGREVI